MASKTNPFKIHTVKTVRSGESLRFRDSKGRLVKFDARKKLISEIWFQGKKTPRTLNKLTRASKANPDKKPIPQKFSSRITKKRILFLKTSKKQRLKTSKIKTKTIKLNANYTITDNLEEKIPEIATDIIKYSRQGSATYVDINFKLKIPTIVNNEEKEVDTEQSISTVIRSSNRAQIYLDLARLIISRLYKNKKRMSNIKKSKGSKNEKTKHIKSLIIKFSWDKTAKLADL